MIKKYSFVLLLLAQVLLIQSCVDEDFVEYRAKDEEFSEAMGEPAYYQITFGNKLNRNDVMAIMCDEQGVNIIGKHLLQDYGITSLMHGTYEIEDGYVIFDWENNNLKMPEKLKIYGDFSGSYITKSTGDLVDTKRQIVFKYARAFYAE